MKVTGLAIIPPKAAEGNPRVTPELLASTLARYSRSNKGIEAILANVDWNDPDKSVDAIFKFVDYGHASISGMTGGIAIAIDGCSMLLAYKLFELAQLSDGQESSTRYIRLGVEALPDPEVVGIPASLRDEWRSCMQESFEVYHEVYEQLDQLGRERPELVRIPAHANEKVADRLRKNFALDRARYLIPFATRSNIALVMTARVWAQTIRQLDAFPSPEAHQCAALLRTELQKFAPRLVRHSTVDDASRAQSEFEVEFSRRWVCSNGVPTDRLPDEVFVKVEDSNPTFLPHLQSLAEAFSGKHNRYSVAGERVRRMMVRFAWNNIALAELRDLNRHRSGYRFTPLHPVGFYLPSEVSHPRIAPLLERNSALVRRIAEEGEGSAAHLYGYLLGVQTPFEHSTHADKFIYEVELRTGLGAHFRYAEHLAAVCEEFLRQVPEARPHVEIGTAEPE